MEKLILKDGTEIEIEAGSFLGYMVVKVDSYADFAEFAEKLTEDNLQNITIGSQIYKNTTISKSEFRLANEEGKIKARFALREMTADELKIPAAEQAAAMLTDEQAVQVKTLYDTFDPNGKSYAVGDRVIYNGYLYKCLQAHTSQADWLPGVAPSLWVALEFVPEEGEESPAGTLEDPIPVPETVMTSGMEYEYGKYYSENGVTYLCKRGGVVDPESMYGQKETLYFAPSALIGQYFEVAEG